MVGPIGEWPGLQVLKINRNASVKRVCEACGFSGLREETASGFVQAALTALRHIPTHPQSTPEIPTSPTPQHSTTQHSIACVHISKGRGLETLRSVSTWRCQSLAVVAIIPLGLGFTVQDDTQCLCRLPKSEGQLAQPSRG